MIEENSLGTLFVSVLLYILTHFLFPCFVCLFLLLEDTTLILRYKTISNEESPTLAIQFPSLEAKQCKQFPVYSSREILCINKQIVRYILFSSLKHKVIHLFLQIKSSINFLNPIPQKTIETFIEMTLNLQMN